jgi:ferredoxin
MKTGPRATEGFDIALTEIVTEEKHFFGLEVGTEKGRQALEGVPQRAVARGENQLLEEFFRNAAKKMGRTLDTTHIRELLTVHAEHPRWDVTATRCLTCTNCTMVCPTCFCSSAEDITDLGGNTAERWRRWDSCFTMEYSYIHGGSIRASVKSRYRQWMTHKLASWFDQFGTSGCVGCGRCITWCPVGIDITEEARAILSTGAGRPPVQAKEKKKHGNA